MVSLTLTCVQDKHEFTIDFPNPVNWDAVNAALKNKSPRCEIHPEPSYGYHDWE